MTRTQNRALKAALFGGAIVAKVKPMNGILLVFIIWALFVLGKVGLAAAFS